MRILVTGSRDWPYPEIVYAELTKAAANATVVEGGAQGADRIAAYWAKFISEDSKLETHCADWAKHGKAAGFIRNQEMVNLGADLCIAFSYNQSRGTADCLNRALTAGIPCRVIDLRISG